MPMEPCSQIVSILQTGDHRNAVVTTVWPHGLTGGEIVTIPQTSNALYSGDSWTVAVVSPTQYTLGSNMYVGDSVGGSWQIMES